VYVTACDLEKSFSFYATVTIIGHVYLGYSIMRRPVLAMINHYAKFEMSVCSPYTARSGNRFEFVSSAKVTLLCIAFPNVFVLATVLSYFSSEHKISVVYLAEPFITVHYCRCPTCMYLPFSE